jgi:hypothetical protein
MGLGLVLYVLLSRIRPFDTTFTHEDNLMFMLLVLFLIMTGDSGGPILDVTTKKQVGVVSWVFLECGDYPSGTFPWLIPTRNANKHCLVLTIHILSHTN